MTVLIALMYLGNGVYMEPLLINRANRPKYNDQEFELNS